MKHIRIIVLSIAAALVVACCAFLTVMNKEIGIPEKTYEEDPQLTALTPYGQKLGKVAKYSDALWDQNWEKIANSAAGYLQNPDVEVTIDNLQQCFYDFLSTPGRLYFFNSNLNASENETHKCDAPEISVNFTGVFQDVTLEECPEDEHSIGFGREGNTSAWFGNMLGAVYITCDQSRPYILFVRPRGETYVDAVNVCFYVNEDLTGKLDAIYMEVLPYSMETAPMETE